MVIGRGGTGQTRHGSADAASQGRTPDRLQTIVAAGAGVGRYRPLDRLRSPTSLGTARAAASAHAGRFVGRLAADAVLDGIQEGDVPERLGGERRLLVRRKLKYGRRTRAQKAGPTMRPPL
jgi:hypothetical protein